MSLLTELFCRHQWKPHCKERYDRANKEVVWETRGWHTPVLNDYIYSRTSEILICEKCGKIKLIEY